MDRETYLKLRNCPDERLCRVLRIAVLAFGLVIGGGVLFNLFMLVWSFIRVAAS